MLKELREKCNQQLKEHGSCYDCPHQDQCAAFQELRWSMIGYVNAEIPICQVSDYFVERFDELIEKMCREEGDE